MRVIVRINKIKIIVIITIFSLVCIFGSYISKAGSIATATDGDGIYNYDVAQAVVEIRLVYNDNNGEQYVIKKGNGFYIGSEETGIYIVTGRNCAALDDIEKNGVLGKYQIEEKDLNLSIQYKIEPDIYMNAAMVIDSQELGIMILSPEENLGDVETLRLCEDSYMNRTGDEVRVFGRKDNEAGYYIIGQIVDWRTEGASHYYVHNVYIDEFNYGCPVINSNNEVIGINMYSKSSSNYALQIKDVINVCEKMGIKYNPEIKIELEELNNVLGIYAKIEWDDFSDKSVEECKQLYEEINVFVEGIENGNVNYETQNIIDDYTISLNEAINNLEEKEISKAKIIKIGIIIISILLTCIVILIIFMLVNKRKYKKMLEAERNNTTTAREALKLSGRISPGKKENRLSANMPLNRSLTTMTSDNQFVVSETSVLGAADKIVASGYSDKIQNNAYIVRKRTGEEILINKNTFIIGKDSEVVDFYISYNPNISRKHACINKIKGNYYIHDLGTTNGTFVDGYRLDDNAESMLQDGTIIMIADEEFEFRK